MEAQPIIIQGTVERVTFYNLESGWGVLRVRIEEGELPPEAEADGTINIVGIMPEMIQGEAARFTGKWVHNPQYGRQLKVDNVYPMAPTNEQGIISYLRDTVFGVGKATAERIYKFFGDDTIDILDRDPMRIHDVPGLKPKIAENVIESWSRNRGLRQVMIHLQSYGVSPTLARRIYDEYEGLALQIVQSDPYQLADELHGVGFKRADQIARGMGMATDAPQRLRAGLEYTLHQLSNDGHTYAPEDALMDKAAELLDVEDRTALKQELELQERSERIIRDTIHEDDIATDVLYLPTYYYSEVGAASRLRTIATSPSKITFRAQTLDWDDFLQSLAAKNAVELTEQQQSAVKAALTSKISVLTGGPGTGKTTTLQMVINALVELEFDFKLASPTGRAAKRLAEATLHEAKTIHRTLGYKPQTGFIYDDDHKLPTDFLIVDEASMIDLVLFYNLLKALDTATHLLLVGDVDQLPSVGAGNVLRDVIDSGVGYVTRLNRIFRQSEKSHIVLNAHRINQGEQPITNNKSEDFYFFGVKQPQEIERMVVDVVSKRVPDKFGHDPLTDVQVIAPMYRGPAGVDALNTALQQVLNPPRPQTIEQSFGRRIFRPNDKVMQTRNDYEKDVYNGDIGLVYAIDPLEEVVQIDMNGQIHNYTFRDAEVNLKHAYCISTHRSQGSEYPVVVMPVMMGHWIMLQRNLLYTAITRAKKLVVLVGERRAVKVAVDNNKVADRYSGLRARLAHIPRKLI
jgi:exodeoxyribonuclease V alpha subunit